MTRTPPWDHYRTFLAVLQEGSLSGAARQLGLKQPTVGRHIDALEKALGVPLFTRSQDGVAATDAAEELRPHAEHMAALAEAIQRTASGPRSEPQGTIRISASDVIGAEVLPPILADLRRTYPALAIELVLSNRPDDLLRREADVAVRMFRPRQGALLAQRIGTVMLGLHAHRDYLDRHGTPGSFAELQGHALIGFDRGSEFVRSLGEKFPAFRREAFALRTDSDLAQLAALRAGYGIGVCQVGLARRDSDLVHLLPEAVAIPLDTWVVMHEDLRHVRRCRVAFDALIRGLRDYVASAGTTT
jgi:DNA-binding transcriptional LysR family regulator